MHMYHKDAPFLASIKTRQLVAQPGYEKHTQHLVLDLSGSGLTYEPGDSIGVYPRHDPALVHQTLMALKGTGDEELALKGSEGGSISALDYLTHRANLTTVSPRLFREVAARQSHPIKRQALQALQEESARDALKEFLSQHEVWDFLMAHEEVSFRTEEWPLLFMPLLPRFYSIASSQKCVGDEVHLLVAPFNYTSNGHMRRGTCTHYLCQLASLHTPEVPVFIQPTHGFRLPSDPEVPLIMIGPGTGVAPFRAFLQERLLHHRSQGKHWLFFGEWHRSHHFFYEDDWKVLSQHGPLQVEVAFSRDQIEKVYVQDRLWEKREEVCEWLDQGAYLYVCGDAKRMAKDVEAMLLRIASSCRNLSSERAKEWLKQLRQEKRYLRDVY